MFAELSLKELKDLVRELRAHHNIAGYSRMKKAALVAELTARFVLRDGAIYLKGEEKAPTKAEAKAEAKAPVEDEKTRVQITKEQLQSRMIKFFKNLSEKELNDTTIEQKIKLFKKRESTDLTKKQKQLFNDLYVSFFS